MLTVITVGEDPLLVDSSHIEGEAASGEVVEVTHVGAVGLSEFTCLDFRRKQFDEARLLLGHALLDPVAVASAEVEMVSILQHRPADAERSSDGLVTWEILQHTHSGQFCLSSLMESPWQFALSEPAEKPIPKQDG
ncbi:hypothetical protein NKH63_19540 [Mesorhizobium sp. M0960]